MKDLELRCRACGGRVVQRSADEWRVVLSAWRCEACGTLYRLPDDNDKVRIVQRGGRA